MILNTLDTETKTIYHEIENGTNYNTISIMDYDTNTQGKDYKINNSQTYVTDMCLINDNSFLICYFHLLLNKIVCKIVDIDGVEVKSGPMCIVDEKTSSTVMSIISLSPTRAILTYNDNLNKVGKSLLLNTENNNITVIEKYIFANHEIPEIATFKLSDTEFVLFYQIESNGVVRLTEFKDDQLELMEEQLFYKGSDLWGLSVQRIHGYFVLIFIDTNHRLVLKIITADKKLAFTAGTVFTTPVEDGRFELISIDDEFAICYFNDQAQIISVRNGQMMSPVPDNF